MNKTNDCVKVKYHTDIPKLEKINKGDWIDLCASEDVIMLKGDFKLIPLGISVELPKGYEANIVPRSSTFKNFKILQTNSFGVVDNTYCGDNDIWKFPALAMDNTIIKKGDRICQFRLNKTMQCEMGNINFVEVQTLGNENRNGFGSTGR